MESVEPYPASRSNRNTSPNKYLNKDANKLQEKKLNSLLDTNINSSSNKNTDLNLNKNLNSDSNSNLNLNLSEVKVTKSKCTDNNSNNNNNNNNNTKEINTNKNGITKIEDISNFINWDILGQVFEMDEDEDEHEFSRSIVDNFYEQAENTFSKMDNAIKEKDLNELSSLGHFLKGSSAALGMTKIKDACEKIQHLGAKKDESGSGANIDEDTAITLKKIEKYVANVRVAYGQYREFFTKYFNKEINIA